MCILLSLSILFFGGVYAASLLRTAAPRNLLFHVPPNTRIFYHISHGKESKFTVNNPSVALRYSHRDEVFFIDEYRVYVLY